MDKQEQIKAWSQLCGRQITKEEYREICENLKGFFGILHEWAKNQIVIEKNRLTYLKKVLQCNLIGNRSVL